MTTANNTCPNDVMGIPCSPEDMFGSSPFSALPEAYTSYSHLSPLVSIGSLKYTSKLIKHPIYPKNHHYCLFIFFIFDLWTDTNRQMTKQPQDLCHSVEGMCRKWQNINKTWGGGKRGMQDMNTCSVCARALHVLVHQCQSNMLEYSDYFFCGNE